MFPRQSLCLAITSYSDMILYLDIDLNIHALRQSETPRCAVIPFHSELFSVAFTGQRNAVCFPFSITQNAATYPKPAVEFTANDIPP